jgi:hypothetical protein
MPTRDVLHIDGFDGGARTASGVIAIEGATLRDVLDQLGAKWHIEREEYEPPERDLGARAREFLDSYVYEDPGSVLALYWRHHSLEAEEFDTLAEAERYLTGEAIVAGDGSIRIWD